MRKCTCRFLLSALMLPAVLFTSSCNKDNITPEPAPSDGSEIAFSQDVLEIPAEGGPVSASFKIVNPVEGIVPSATCEADWIHIAEVNGKAMRVSLIVGKNTESTKREADLVLTYGDEISDTLRLVQSMISFTINVTDSTTSSFAYEVIPKDTAMTYFSQVVEKEYFDQFGSPEEFINADVELIRTLAAEQGLTFEECLKNVLKKGNYSKNLTYQSFQKQYVIYAFGMDYSGNILTGLDSRAASTAPVEQSDITFDIEVTQEGRSTVINIVPSDKEQTYIAEVVDAKSFDEPFDNKPGADYIFEYKQNMLWQYIDMYTALGYPDPYATLLGNNAITGDYTITTELSADTDNVVFAVSINEECILNSEPEIVRFHTDDVIMSDNVLTLDIQNVETRFIDASVTTTNDDPYVLLALEAAPYKGLSKEELFEKLAVKRYTWIYSGDTTVRFGFPDMDYKPETEYLVFAFGYDLGNPTTDLVYEFVTTTEAKQSDMTFELAYHGYYAGAEVQEAYPENFTADISGHAVYHVKAQAIPEDRMYYKYYTVLSGDYTDTEAFTDDEAVDMLLELWETSIGVSWSYNMILLAYDYDYTFIGYAIDVAGNPSAVWRQLVHPTEDGTVPMGGFNPGDLWNWDYNTGTATAGGNGWMIPLIMK